MAIPTASTKIISPRRPAREHVFTQNQRKPGHEAQKPVEVQFDRICRENGIAHLLTKVVSADSAKVSGAATKQRWTRARPGSGTRAMAAGPRPLPRSEGSVIEPERPVSAAGKCHHRRPRDQRWITAGRAEGHSPAGRLG